MEAAKRNPHFASIIRNYSLDPATLASFEWGEDSDTWTEKELSLFIGSNGFLKPKRAKAKAAAAVPAPAAPAAPATSQDSASSKPAAAYPSSASTPAKPPVAATTAPAAPAGPSGLPADFKAVVEVGLQGKPSGFEDPGFSMEHHAITLPVRVHCEDTSPLGHVRLESLVAYAERIRSLSLKTFLGLSLNDLKKLNLAILANEYVAEIVGKGCGVMETLRIDTTPEFPGAPLFPWTTEAYTEDGELYMKGLFGLSLCTINPDGSYRGTQKDEYEKFTRVMKHWSNPKKRAFSATSLRFFNAFPESGSPFKPTARRDCTYVVRSADCDLYSVLFQARVTSMTESCHDRRDALGMYVNIMASVRPSDELTVFVLYNEDSALFLFTSGASVLITAFGRYGSSRPLCREELKCCSMPGYYQKLLKYCKNGDAAPPTKDYDLSALK